MQCCTCYNWVHFKCSLLSFARFRTLGRSHSWSFPPCCIPVFLEIPHLPALCLPPRTPPAGIPPLLNLTLFCQCSTRTSPSPSNLLSFFRPLCISSLCTLTTSSCSWLFLFTSCFLFLSLTPSGFCNGILGVSETGALNCYTLFHLIPLTSFVPRNLTLIYLSLSGSPDSLLCDSMAPTPDLVFFLLLSQTLAAASSFSSGRAYPSLSFLPPLFFCLTPNLIM